MSDRMRLDRYLAFLGCGTRSEVKDLLRAGRVSVDGAPERDGGRHVDAGAARVALDGKLLCYKRHRHLMMNKPAGVLTAAEDARAQTVLDLLPPLYRACGCMPVGRLDKDTEGLLLLTSDGALGHRIISPKRRVDKVYFARVDGPLGEADVQAFAEGLQLSDFRAMPARLEIVSSAPQEAEALCTVQEGKFHQVKRMFSSRGVHVVYLKRLSIGPVLLDPALAPGGYRELTDAELEALIACTTPSIPTDAQGGSHA